MRECLPFVNPTPHRPRGGVPVRAGERPSVVMCVVRIRYMRMHVPQRVVAMAVAMRGGRHRNVDVVVVAVVVAVRMFMLHHLVLMLVLVRLRQVQHHACKHQHAARRYSPAKRLVAQSHGQRRSDERSKGEY